MNILRREMKVQKNAQLKFPQVKNEMSEVENTLVEVTADQKLKKERLVNFKKKKRQQKVYSIRHRKENDWKKMKNIKSFQICVIGVLEK